eukprot:GHVS01026715.1.p1 GENE.GHVS01026715.1~~GHVS01026715.1.p1  ORF type:complete len:1171 (-),score=194.93 GHVS01026715.1:154-3666(-)
MPSPSAPPPSAISSTVPSSTKSHHDSHHRSSASSSSPSSVDQEPPTANVQEVSWDNAGGYKGRAESFTGLTAFRVEELSDVSAENVEKARNLSVVMQNLADANILYLRCFQLLKLGGLEAEIPRLVVFGQQSMGKTTLLDFIMGGPIGYSSTDTGTRQPVVIMLKPSETGRIECSLAGQDMDVKSLQDAMKERMSAAGETISAEELEVELAVPGGVHAVFVDLPGIKDDSKSGAELTRSVVRGYVQNNPNDLYILVKKASDDPANWPWSLREFILSPAPKGLGLTPKQTVVVGTRAKDFLANEKNDVRSQQQLLDRVQKRAVKDSNNNPLPLFFLELFSLSIELKDSFDFLAKRDDMNFQIRAGRQQVLELLTNSFEALGSLKNRQVLLDYFDVEKFKKELNVKFQVLLNDQLGVLERRLIKKRLETQKRIGELEDQISQQGPQSVREYMKLYLRELLETVTELVTGNYTIIRLPEAGDRFLATYGGNLLDNLREGHQLAMDLFPEKEHYDPEFLEKIVVHTEEIFARHEAMDSSVPRDNVPKDVEGRVFVHAGQLVRFVLSRDETNLFGLVQSVQLSDAGTSPSTDPTSNPPDAAAAPAPSQRSPRTSTSATVDAAATHKNIVVTFYFRPSGLGSQFEEGAGGGGGQDQTQNKTVERSRLTILVPLMEAVSPNKIPSEGVRCWQRTYRADGWVGLEEVQVLSMQPQSGSSVELGGETDEGRRIGGGEAVIATILSGAAAPSPSEKKSGFASFVSSVGRKTAAVASGVTLGERQSVKLEELFIDSPNESGSERSGNVATRASKNVSAMQRIAGEFAENKLLNQLSMTHLGRWLKFHVVNLEPDRRFSEDVLLQMMRSVRHVIDKADWEPLVADLLQANVRGGMLQVARLSACAAAAALRRILRAACAEVFRLVQTGDLTAGLTFLSSNPRFMEELEQALEDYCRRKALDCTNAMRDMIFEQTHAIHFEMIEDFFDGCKQFENDFLDGNLMEGVAQRVKESLAVRKQRLGIADVYSRHQNSGAPNSMIYEEVRMQFWVVKMLLAAPLTTKLYMYFVKDIKDKSMHLASEQKYTMSCESDLERSLQETILSEKTAAGRYLPRSDDDLMSYFDLSVNKDELLLKIHAARRTEEYVKLALDGVSKLRQQIHKQGGVDFLMRLDISGTVAPGATR